MSKNQNEQRVREIEAEHWERLPALAAKNNIPLRSIYAFVRDGMRVTRPLRGRSLYSRQSWLNDYLAKHSTPPGEML